MARQAGTLTKEETEALRTVARRKTKARKGRAMSETAPSIFITEAVWNAVQGRQVHWFATPADAAVAVQVDGMPWESRRDFVKSITGY